MFKNSFDTKQKIYLPRRFQQLMLYMKIIDVFENNKEDINMLCVKNAETLMLRSRWVDYVCFTAPDKGSACCE